MSDDLDLDKEELTPEEKEALEQEAKAKKLYKIADQIRLDLLDAFEEQNPNLENLKDLEENFGVDLSQNAMQGLSDGLLRIDVVDNSTPKDPTLITNNGDPFYIYILDGLAMQIPQYMLRLMSSDVPPNAKSMLYQYKFSQNGQISLRKLPLNSAQNLMIDQIQRTLPSRQEMILAEVALETIGSKVQKALKGDSPTPPPQPNL